MYSRLFLTFVFIPTSLKITNCYSAIKSIIAKLIFTSVSLYPIQAELLEDRFNWNGQAKKKGSMFVGTSPELEMATYTVCFFARVNGSCPVQMGDIPFQVKTFTIHGDSLVGSAYPEIL